MFSGAWVQLANEIMAGTYAVDYVPVNRNQHRDRAPPLVQPLALRSGPVKLPLPAEASRTSETDDEGNKDGWQPASQAGGHEGKPDQEAKCDEPSETDEKGKKDGEDIPDETAKTDDTGEKDYEGWQPGWQPGWHKGKFDELGKTDEASGEGSAASTSERPAKRQRKLSEFFARP